MAQGSLLDLGARFETEARPARPTTGLHPAGRHDRAPLLDTLRGYRRTGIRALHTPGHKRGAFAPPEMLELFGPELYRMDLPSMGATDNTFHPEGCIAEAEELAADLYGAAHTRFLAGGSTLGILASVLATVGEGDTLLVARNVHRSVLSALVLSGATPRYLVPRVDPACGALGLTVEAVREALDADPRVRALLLPRPSYYGLGADLHAIGTLCRERGVVFIVDEAHGSHLRFLPEGAGPAPALDAPVDVVVQSPHKTLGALVGAAQVHLAHGGRLDAGTLSERLNVLQTTSPSNLVLASLDAVRRQMALEGRAIWAEGLQRVRTLRALLSQVPRVRVLGEDRPAPGGHVLDPFRLVVEVSGLGRSGFEVEALLREARIEDELCDSHNVAFVLGPRDEPALWDDLLDAFRGLAAQAAPEVVSVAAPEATLPDPVVAITPRRAAFAAKERVRVEEARGRVAGEVLTFYPPGIPLACPGEVLTDQVLDACVSLAEGGARVHASDPELRTVLVVR